ncbi:MAG TPA: hypothetical protein DEQ45_19650 [Agrobacterium sp.]|jgi:uncharacterized protein (DUF433 family)|uniref:DUF433 domain-containing protein n=1 Tax=Rhizobium sp. TaxID=391 RepID=UPI000EE3BC8D|nr:hypothetical protein [Agrobacterium sp.]
MAEILRAYTPAEAAAVSEIAVKSVHNAIDKRIIVRRRAEDEGRALSDDDLLRLKLWYGVGSILSAERRQRLFDTIDQNPDADTVRADDYLIVDVARAREQLAARAEALREAERIIRSVKGVLGGEPVFNNSRVPVRAIAAMKAQGATTVEIVEGYPSLTARMVELAEIWTAAHPARGRPRKLSELGATIKSSKRISLPKPASNPTGSEES